MLRTILVVFVLLVGVSFPVQAHVFEDGSVHPHDATRSAEVVVDSLENASSAAQVESDSVQNSRGSTPLDRISAFVAKTVEDTVTKLSELLSNQPNNDRSLVSPLASPGILQDGGSTIAALPYQIGDDLDPTLWEGGIVPYPDAPLCESHSETEYHTLWNKELGCHYDHHHGYDPAKTPFKDIVATWEQGVSYEWQTPSENQNKHKGYIYLYSEAKDGCELGRHQDTAKGCVRKVLYQLHSIGTNSEVTTRFHSFRFVAEVCNLDQTNCGFVQGGGQSDYGVTHCPYKKEACPKASDVLPLPGDNGVLPDTVAITQPPYVAAGLLSDLLRIQSSGRNTQFWNGFTPNKIVAQYYPHAPNTLFSAAWSSVDGWTLIQPGDDYKEHYICEDSLCKFNHSEFRLYAVKITLPKSAQAGGTTYTTVFGHAASGCIEATASCVPLVIDATVPVGVGTFNLDRQVNPLNAPELEFDICFDQSTGKPQGCNSVSSVTSGWSKPQMMNMEH